MTQASRFPLAPSDTDLDTRARCLLEGLTLREKIGQKLLVAFRYWCPDDQPACTLSTTRFNSAMGDALREQLGDAIEFVQPEGGLFLWARLTGARGQLADAAVLAKKAIEEGVAFVPGAPFYAQNPDTATFRLSFATADEDKIRAGIARLAKALKV